MIGVIGWLGSGLVVLSLIQQDIRRLRQVNLAASIALGIFNVALGISSMIALNAVLAGVNGYHLLMKRGATRHSVPTQPGRSTTARRDSSGTERPDDAQLVEQDRDAADIKCAMSSR